MKIRAVILSHWFLFLTALLLSVFTFVSSAEEKQEQNFKIQVSVEEVRIDAVVLDKKGRQIADLTAKDFEIFQDGAKQEIVSLIYVADQTQPIAQPRIPKSSERKKSVPLSPIPTQAPRRDEVRRTIVFLIDDIAMNFEMINNARMSLVNFVNKQMQPGDMVAVVRTGSGNSALQMFLSDQRELLARINQATKWSTNGGRELGQDNLFPIFDGQVSALNYCVRALDKMPGRKAIVFMTPEIVLPDFTLNGNPNYRERYLSKMNRISDAALRAGVVVHFMDIRMLEYQIPERKQNSFGLVRPQLVDMKITESMSLQNPLPKRTGGLLVENHNFHLSGIGEVNDALKGYYLLSYVPPANTFTNEKTKEKYRRIEIRVKRSGVNVHTRDGFFSAQPKDNEPENEFAPLRDALFDPFHHKDLSINLSSGYVNNAQAGYLVRSWVHLDAKNLEIVKKESGPIISLQTISLLYDAEGIVKDSSLMKYDFGVKEENIQWIREHGLRFSLLAQVKKPGDYFVRIGVRDQASGKAGSAYDFVQVPELKKGRLAISNMFVVTNKDDASWVLTGVNKEDIKRWLTPNISRDETRSPALRSYKPGDNFEYVAVLYNAVRKNYTPDLESQFILYRNGTERMRGEPQKIELDGIVDLSRIPIRKKMLLGNNLEQGDYVLQLLVIDKKQKKPKPVTQTLTFQIEPK
jgi:VWFA-related protein